MVTRVRVTLYFGIVSGPTLLLGLVSISNLPFMPQMQIEPAILPEMRVEEIIREVGAAEHPPSADCGYNAAHPWLDLMGWIMVNAGA